MDNGHRGHFALVVGAEIPLSAAATNIVRQGGFDVLEAANGDEALELLFKGYPVSIVLTDVKISGSVDGLELAECVRDYWPMIHIVLVSGNLAFHYRWTDSDGRSIARHECTEQFRVLLQELELGISVAH